MVIKDLHEFKKGNISDYFKCNTHCPLCMTEKSNSSKLFTVQQLFWDINVLKCNVCSVAYKEYFPNKKLINNIYDNDYTHFSASSICDNPSLKALAHRIDSLGIKKGRHLDYGCGSGQFVAAALKAGWDSYGADPYMPEMKQTTLGSDRFFKIDVSKQDYSSMTGKFDVISLWAVFEHMSEPLQTLRGIEALLNPGGRIIFNSPNSDSIIAKRCGDCWRIATLIEHLIFFSPECIYWIAAKLGLIVESLKISGSPYPFGKTDKGSLAQGIGTIPMKYYIINGITQNPILTTNKINPNIFNKIKSKIYHRLIQSSSNDIIPLGSITRSLINLLKLGDHMEIVFVKEIV